MDIGNFDLTGLEAYRPDSGLEATDGVWVPFPGNREICVLRAGGANAKFQRVFQRMIRPYQRQIKRNDLDQEISIQIMRETYLQAVIVNWRGWTDKNGDEIPYSIDSMRGLLEASPAILDDLIEVASDAANYSEEEIEEAKK